MLKVDLHTHTAEDPVDPIPYGSKALIDRAAALGFQALAITLHDYQLESRELSEYARERDIVLIRGIERTVQGKHVLLINFPAPATDVERFEEIAALKEAHGAGLVIAPHPFHPSPKSLGRLLDRYPDLWDAIEFSSFYTRRLDFNRWAVRWARRHDRPLVGTSDAHRLDMLDLTYTLVDAEPTADAICAAIRAGRVEIRTRPLAIVGASILIGGLVLSGAIRRARSAVRSRIEAASRPSCSADSADG